jgi:hypothetical protein
MLLSELKKGDIFKFGDKDWDAKHKLHSLVIKPNGKIVIFFFSINFQGTNEEAKSDSFTWRDTDVEVFIPKFYLSEQRRTKGLPCIPVSNMRHIIGGEVNPINMSDVYCCHDKYWYDIL